MTPCILIPCYNHAGPLAAVLARLAEYGLPCLLIDDGSEPVAAAAQGVKSPGMLTRVAGFLGKALPITTIAASTTG